MGCGVVGGGIFPEPQALKGQVWGKEAKRFLWGLVEAKGGGVLGTEAPRGGTQDGGLAGECVRPSGCAWAPAARAQEHRGTGQETGCTLKGRGEWQPMGRASKVAVDQEG